ncbi:hypothetical protein C8N47_1242 [Mangrovibacterium marinum]|uniref:Uncharacterized protein n=1 Tax=Mangrovibacterium marinum TaxID=1639118 RepID=A0A2T5BXX3_9BACT|nr:hypothetical protein C8N47_1242 [Mangrovibacterium marinum]
MTLNIKASVASIRRPLEASLNHRYNHPKDRQIETVSSFYVAGSLRGRI